MLEFRRLMLGDIDKVRKYFPYSVTRICDNTVGGAFMWRDYFLVEFAEYNETIIFKSQVKYHRLTAFSMPLGKDLRGSIDQIVEYCRSYGMPVAFSPVTNEDVDVLQMVFSDFQLLKDPDWSDYVYYAADLINLSGRKFSGQRNHINYFKRTHEDYSFEEISAANLGHVRDFYARLSSRLDIDSEIFAEEHNKTVEVLENYDAYGLLGALLRVRGDVIAFSVGEINRDVLFIHIEKANAHFRGAYQIINNEFARRFASEDVLLINREEDVGDEGLRTSKNSYHPSEIIDKYIFLGTGE